MPDTASAPLSHLGAALKARRVTAELSQRALSRAANVPQSTISQLESGAQANADLPTVTALATALGCTASGLLGADVLGTDAHAPPHTETGIIMVPHSNIRRSDLNPRRVFDPEKLAELADSIDTDGILENLLVRIDPANPGDWLVVAGERRWRAVGLLVAQGRRPPDTLLPVRVVEADEVRHRVLAIVENLQREDVAPLDEARAFRALTTEEGWSTARIGKAIGKTDRHVQLRLALLARLHPDIQDALDAGRCNLATARALTAAPMALQPELLEMMDDGGAYGIRTSEDLTAYIRSGLRTAATARFRLEDYVAEGGERFDDPESGEIYLLDSELFVRLQHAAIDALEADLKARYAWVERTSNPFWEPATQTGYIPAVNAPIADLAVGVMIRVTDGPTATVFTDLVKLPAPTRRADSPMEEATGGDHQHDDDDGHEDAAPQTDMPQADPVAAVSPARRAYALKAKTEALQAALLSHPDAWMHQLALALMGCRDVADIVAPPPMPQNATVAAPVLDVLRRYRSDLGGDALFLTLNDVWPYLTLSRTFEDAFTASVSEAALAVLPRLQALPPERLGELLAALTACRCATRFLPARSNLGDPALTLATAAAVGADGTPWRIDTAYLDTLDDAGLVRLARRVGLFDEGSRESYSPDLFASLKRRERIGLLAEHVATNDVRHLPPELRFASRHEIEAALHAEAEDTP